MMFTELLKAEVWRKKLEANGYRVILEPKDMSDDPDKTGKYKKVAECQSCGTMTTEISNGLCPHCGGI